MTKQIISQSRAVDFYSFQPINISLYNDYSVAKQEGLDEPYPYSFDFDVENFVKTRCFYEQVDVNDRSSIASDWMEHILNYKNVYEFLKKHHVNVHYTDDINETHGMMIPDSTYEIIPMLDIYDRVELYDVQKCRAQNSMFLRILAYKIRVRLINKDGDIIKK